MTGKCYRSLSSLISEATESRLSVCIVTPDLLGPVKNGGIGTACTYLAYALADAGYRVEILFTQTGAGRESAPAWTKSYEAKGIAVTVAESLSAEGEKYFPNHPPLHMARIVHDWLAAQSDFDLVLFMEWQGSGFYALHAKRCGLLFSDTIMAVVIHSPSLWHSINNAAAPANPIESCTWHMERRCVEMADAVISPSAYMLDWCRQHDYALPTYCFVQPNILDWPSDWVSRDTTPVNEVVFFGRLEYRKGLEQFCAALDILAKSKRLPKKVTFLGKCAWMGDEHSVVYIAKRARAWKKCTISFLLHCDHQQAVTYLCGKGRLAVMPSVADNSPYTVYECLTAGIPFLARNVGGIGELIAPEWYDSVLFGDNPHELARKISHALGKAPCRAALSFDSSENRTAWSEGLAELTSLLRSESSAQIKDASSSPLISVCLVHYNRPQLLRQAVDSLIAQTYPHFEVILADDGSTDREAKALLRQMEQEFAHRGWRILRLENGYVGRARNIAAQHAKGEWLLFFDDDNVAKPHMLETFARAVRASTAGLIVASYDVFEGIASPCEQNRQESFLPTGSALAYAVIHNTLGDTTSLISRASFERVQGFREDYGLGHEDFELFLRLLLSGESVVCISDALFWYRRAETKSSVQRNTNAPANRMRSLRPFMELCPASVAELALMTHGMAEAERLYATPLPEQQETTVTPPTRTLGVDPQSDSTLSQVTAWLMANKEEDLANQLINSSNQPGSMLEAKAMKAARHGDITRLEQLIAEFESSCSQQPTDQEYVESRAFYTTILASLPNRETLHGMRREILEKLKSVTENEIKACLIITQHSMLLGNMDQAVLYFFKALSKAEMIYLKYRQDVAKAIEDAYFICALHHYCKHGVSDKIIWPELNMFKNILSNNLLSSLVCIAHMNAYKYGNRALAEQMIGVLK